MVTQDASALEVSTLPSFSRSRLHRTGRSWEAGNATFGLDQAGVGLGTFSPTANKTDIAATEKVEQQIADGTVTGIPTTLG